MARFIEPTADQRAAWHIWVAQRPAHVRAIAEQVEPWSLYRLKSTGWRVTLVSFGEATTGEVTLKVNVTGAFNQIMFDRVVFGVHPADLEPCDVPGADTPVGTILKEQADIDMWVDMVREQHENA